MNLEQQIHAFLVFSVGGNSYDVKGISATQLTKMKQGKSGISTKKLKEILKLNDLKGTIELSANGVSTVISFY